MASRQKTKTYPQGTVITEPDGKVYVADKNGALVFQSQNPIASDVKSSKEKYGALGLTNLDSYVSKGKFNEAKAQADVVKNIYGLDPKQYTKNGVLDFKGATEKYQYELPKITLQKNDPTNFTQAVTRYSDALSSIRSVGIENINSKDYTSLQSVAKQLRDFDSKDLGVNAKQIIANAQQAIDAIDEVRNQRDQVTRQAGRVQQTRSGSQKQSEQGKLFVEQDKLARLVATANQNTPKYIESFSRFGLEDIGGVTGQKVAGVAKVSAGLEALRGENFFDASKSGLAGKLNLQVTDDQILNDINTQKKNQYKSLYDIGTAATTDLQSQITQANQFLADLPSNDRRRVETQKSIDSLTSELAQAQKDTLEAKNLYEGYQPISGEQATSALAKVRESLRLPEERTLAQIEQIDPTIGATVRGLAKQYQTMAETPLEATTSPETEAFRRDVEQRIAGQVALGSQLGAEEQRQYQQAARAAQTARGNIFGVAPAVEEAVTTGLAGEQRLQARLGAAQGFLASGQSMSDAMARDVGLRNALTQSRLGAAQGFIASGPTLYNLASQRLGQQQNILNNYLAASAPQSTGGFQATPSAANPYAYVNPNAGFVGAQNAASIHNTLSDLQASQYGSQVGAIANSYRSPGQEFASIAGGISGFSGLFGSPGSNAFFRG